MKDREWITGTKNEAIEIFRVPAKFEEHSESIGESEGSNHGDTFY